MDSEFYPTIFLVDIDAFFASVEEALCPALKGRPVVVGGLPNQRGVVSCPNYAARRLGVRTAMPLTRAYALAPNAVFVRGNYAAYEKYSRRFVEILHDFSPVVRPVSLDEAFLDADGCLHFWNNEPGILAAAIKSAVSEELNISVSIGVASNKVCAKVASDYSKKIAMAEKMTKSGGGTPNGLLIVPLGKEKEFLAPLPVSAIPGIGRRTTENLEALGISTIDRLANTSPDSLKKIFGAVGTFLHDASNGRGERRLSEDERGTKSISRSTTFASDSGDEEFISSVFFYLAEKIGRELRANGQTASTVTVKMRYSDGAPLLGYRKESSTADRRFVTYQKSRTLDSSTNSEFEIASTGFELFKSLWLEGMKVRLVGIGVTNFRDECRQTDLFASRKERQEDLLHGVDKIRRKFGYDSVYFGIVDRIESRHRGVRCKADLSEEHFGYDSHHGDG